MRKIYLRIGMVPFCLLLMTGIISNLSAQEIRYVDIAPGIGTLNEAIMGDTTETGARVDTFNTVYRLQRVEDIYYISSLISNIGWPLTVVAEDGDGPRPYLALKTDDTGGTPSYCFRPKGDLTLQGLHLTNLDDLGATASRMIRASADGITLTLDDCWMDDAHQAAFRLDNDDMSLYLTNCVISNIGHPNDASNGRAIDDRGNPIDTLVFENCTFYNVTQRILRDGGGWIKYSRMNNNTFVNVGSRGFSFGEIAGLDFTNNVLVNVGFLPQDTSSQEAMIEIDEIGAELAGLGFTQEINISNNNFYLDTTLFAQYLNDTTMATLVADSLAQVFIDEAENPRLFYVPVALTDPPVDLQNFIDHQMDPALDPADADDWSNPDPPGFYHLDVPYDFGYVNSRVAGGGQDGVQLGDRNWTAEREAMTVVDFEDPLDRPFFYQFANAGDAPENLNIIANPDASGINTSDMVLEFVVQDGADPWAGAWTDAFGNMEFTQEKHHMEMMVWKEVASNSALKVERGGTVTEVKVPNTVTGQWELLQFDFTANIGETLTRLVFFPDFPDSRTAGTTVYLDNIQIVTGSTVGVETLEGNTLRVYPNPAIDQMIVEYPGMKSIQIRDILGKTVNAVELQGDDTYTISVKNLADGVYFITVAADGNSYSTKFLKR